MLRARRGPQHEPTEQERSQPERAVGVLELGDCFLRCVRRDDPHGAQAIAVRRVALRVVPIACPRQRATHLVVVECHRHQTQRRVQQREVDADVVEALVQQLRQHRGGAIERVHTRQRPPSRTAVTHGAPSRIVHCAHERRAADHLVEPARDVVAGLVGNQIPHQRHELDAMTVGVDHGVIESSANCPRAGRASGVAGQAYTVRVIHSATSAGLSSPSISTVNVRVTSMALPFSSAFVVTARARMRDPTFTGFTKRTLLKP